jgi:hypothetical protein
MRLIKRCIKNIVHSEKGQGEAPLRGEKARHTEQSPQAKRTENGGVQHDVFGMKHSHFSQQCVFDKKRLLLFSKFSFSPFVSPSFCFDNVFL